MKRAFVLLLLALAGCGSIDSRHANTPRSSQPGNAVFTISGFVSTIQLTTSATSLGSNSLVTVVNFIPPTPQPSLGSNVVFCGNVANDFVLNTFATVSFTQAQGCSNLVSPNLVTSASGLIILIQASSITVNGIMSPTTVVTFVQQVGPATTITFCGNVTPQFALNTFTTVVFTSGQGCSTLVLVSV